MATKHRRISSYPFAAKSLAKHPLSVYATRFYATAVVKGPEHTALPAISPQSPRVEPFKATERRDLDVFVLLSLVDLILQ